MKDLKATSQHSIRMGILCMIIGIGFYGLLDAGVKWLSSDYSSFQIAFFRSIFAFIALIPMIYFKGGVSILKTYRPYDHIVRGLIAFFASILFMISLKHMPLVDVTVISFASPLFVTALAIPVLKETVGPYRFFAVIIGFIGVLIVLQPGQSLITIEALIVLSATFFYAFSGLLTRKMSWTEDPVSITFWSMVIFTVITSLSLPFVWVTPNWSDLIFLVLIGIAGGLGQLFVTLAFKFSPAVIVSPFEYSGLIWAIILGMLVWNEKPGYSVWIGSAIIILSGLFILYRETRQKPNRKPLRGEGIGKE